LLLLEFDENWNLGREVGMMPLQERRVMGRVLRRYGDVVWGTEGA
jgi:hypothetical protein